MELLLKLGVFLLLVAVGYWRGRRNERAHLAEIERLEDELRDVLVFSSRYPPRLARATDPVLVSGSVVVASDFYRLLLASLRKVVGGNYRAYENMLSRGRRHALVRLKQDARARGARMVFNVRFETARISNAQRGGEAAQVEVLAYGTAFVAARGAVADSRVHHQPSAHISDLDSGQTDLARHKGSKWWLLAWLAGVLYVLAEMVTDRFWPHAWRYVNGAPWWLFGVLAALATAALMWRARRHRLPWASTAALGVLTLPLIPFVLYFALLRLNGATAAVPPPVPYTVQPGGTLRTEAPGVPPVLRFGDYMDYWAEQKPGEQVPLVLARGWLGFWQFDQNSVRERYTAHYQNTPPRR